MGLHESAPISDLGAPSWSGMQLRRLGDAIRDGNPPPPGGPLAGFVIEYNRRTGRSRVTEFVGTDGHRDALRRRLQLEKSRENTDVEIVSLASDTIETVRRTHSRYFMDEYASA